jgi:hypothetical protein
VEHVQNDDSVDDPEVSLRNIANLDVRDTAQRHLRSPRVPTPQFNASE